MQTSTRRTISYPNLTRTGDVPDIPAHIKNLVDFIDQDMPFSSGTLASRPTAGFAGRIYRVTSGTNTGSIYFDNGTSWDELARVGIAVEVPVGGMVDWPWASGSMPAWAVLPYGQLLTNASYPAMQTIADASGRPYGGTAGTNFNMPDMRGRITAGKDDMGGSTAGRITAAISGTAGTVLGGAMGGEGVTLTTGQMPAHNHSATMDSQGSHSHGGATGNASPGTDNPGDHVHGTVPFLHHLGSYLTYQSGSAYTLPTPDVQSGTQGGGNHSHTVNSHGHSISVDGAHAHNITVVNTGGGAAVAILQPTIIVNKIMRVI